MKGAVADKLFKVLLLLPAWAEYGFRWLLRFNVLLATAAWTLWIHIADFIFVPLIMARDWVYYEVWLPILEFLTWLIGAIIVIASIPW